MSAAKMESKQASKEANDAANDPARALAYVLRGNKGPEARSARLEDSRVDYFRGKDLYRALKARPEIIDEYAPKLTGVPTPTAPTEKDRAKQITAMGQELLKRGYFVKCDRVYKTARPGRTKRVKFPKFLHQVPRAAQTFTEDGEGFYSWTYDQPMSWTFVIISFLVAFMVILMCLFPLSPIWFKKLILYFCLAILGLFFVVGVVRVFVFAVVWIVFGRHFWVLPNITSDEIPIDEVFSPMWAFDDLDANGNVVGKISAINRLAAAGSAAAAPRRGAVRDRAGEGKRHQVHQPRARLDTGPVRPVRHPQGARGGGGERDGRGQRGDGAGGQKKAGGERNRRNRRGGETATAAGADDGHRTSDIDPLEEDVAPPAPPPPYGGPEAPEDGSAADAETKAEL